MRRAIIAFSLGISLTSTLLADTQEEYQDYLEGIKAKRDMLTEASIATWHPLYNTVYTMLNGQFKGLIQRAKTPQELANAKKLLAHMDEVNKELAECYQINMALEFPDAPVRDAVRVAKSMEYKNPYLMPPEYENGLAMVTMNCSQSPSKPYSD